MGELPASFLLKLLLYIQTDSSCLLLRSAATLRGLVDHIVPLDTVYLLRVSEEKLGEVASDGCHLRLTSCAHWVSRGLCVAHIRLLNRLLAV